MRTYKKLLKIFLLLLAPMALAANNYAGNCKAGFTWKETSPNVISFTNTSNGANASSGISLWSFGDASGGWTKDPVHAYAKPGKYEVCLSFTNADSTCSSYICETIVVGAVAPVCKAAFTWTKNGDDIVHFKSQSKGTSSNTIYRWELGDGVMAYGNYADHRYFSPGLYKVCLYISDTLTHCTSAFCDTIRVKEVTPSCKVRFTWEQIRSDAIEFKNISAKTAVKVLWDFGDGGSDNNVNPLHVYDKSGKYLVCLKNYDSVSNCYSSFCDTISINIICQARFTSYRDTGNVVHFVNTSTGTTPTTTYFWDFGDGYSSTDKNPVHKYKTTVDYYVNLNINDKVTSCTSSFRDLVSFKCQAYFKSIKDSGRTIQFVNKSMGVTTSARAFWNFGDGQSGMGNLINHTYALPGLYNVCLYIKDTATQCTNTFCDTVRITEQHFFCKADFVWKQTQAQTVNFFNNSKGITNTTRSHWSFGDATSSWGKDVVHIYNKPGQYNVCLTIIDTASNCNSSVCYNVTISAGNCKAGFTVVKTNINTIAFTNKSEGITPVTRYYWNFGDGSTASAKDVTHQYAKSGAYMVCLEIKDSVTKCNTYHCDTVIVTTDCKARFTWKEGLNNTFYFVNTSDVTNHARYYWKFSSGEVSYEKNPVTVLAPGINTVCLFVEDAGNCVSSFCDTIKVNPLKCAARFWILKDSVKKNSYYIINKSSGTGTLTQTWKWDDGTSDTIPYPTHTFTTSGRHYICLDIKDAAGCNSSSCDSVWFDSSPTTIKVIPSGNAGIKETSILNTLNIYPNPVQSRATISYTLNREANVKINIYNLLGEKISELTNVSQPFGTHEINWNTNDLSQGIYLISIIINDSQVDTKRVNVVKQ